LPRRWRAPTLGPYLARDFSGATGLVIFLLAIGAIVGLNIAASRGREQLAIGFLFGPGCGTNRKTLKVAHFQALPASRFTPLEPWTFCVPVSIYIFWSGNQRNS
jgi:hypothetical protein